ncbi:protein TESPA1 isoform X3 [Aphelocoma coerulescens]|uniref:protein TESPA1 isoform X3 n=1 Tax=Aphelocoma coerulescens TaxID=39617 RepID=UPI003604A9FA
MEGPSVLGPFSWQKRCAWAQQSRGWRSPAPEGEQEEEEEEEEEEQEAAAVPWDIPEPPPHLDDVVLEGGACSKIQTWLQDCGATALEEPGLPGPCACGSSGTSFEDDLTLGAEALLLPGSLQAAGSLSEVLAWWQSDAEEILHNLGFVGTDPGVASRVPPRFFSAPSRASGIDLGLFLRAQVRRLEMEDPCLLLASRFQQVQALAATADAFFCLYSYVSRTPLQRIGPPRPAWPYRDIPDSPELRGARPGPAPPGERLKRAVSSLCLYTGRDGDIPRGSRGATLGPRSAPGTGGLRKDPGGAPEGWRRDGDAGTVQRGPSPRPTPVGTPAGPWGAPERSWTHGRAVWGPGGAPCPAGAAQRGTRDPRPDAAAPWDNVTVSPTLGPLSPHASRVGVTPEPPVGLEPEGDSGFGSWCHPGATAGAGGHRAGLRGGPPGLQPPGRVPSPLIPRGAAESFELEEVLSEEEEEDGDDDEEEDDDDDAAPEEAAWSPHPSVRTRRSELGGSPPSWGTAGVRCQRVPAVSPPCPRRVPPLQAPCSTGGPTAAASGRSRSPPRHPRPGPAAPTG